MLGDLISALWGPLGGILGGVGAVVAALVLGRWQGGRDANAKRDADDMKDAYDRERTRNEIERNSANGDARGKLRKDWQRGIDCAGWRAIPLDAASIDGLTDRDAAAVLAHNLYGRERGCW